MGASLRVVSLWATALTVLVLAAATPAAADLRISDLDVFLNDHELTVNVSLLGAVPGAFQEGIQSGIPAHIRYTVELWQYNRYWRDVRLLARVVSDLRALKLTPAAAMNPTDVIYVRVHAEAALNGENSFVTRMAGTAEETMRQSEYRTITRVQ